MILMIFRRFVMDLFFREATVRIGADDVLTKIDALLDWQLFSPILKRGLGRSGIGRQGYDPLAFPSSTVNRASNQYY